MHYFILYSSWIQANAGGEHAVIDIAKVSCILCGIIFIVLGNFMTKAKRNAVVGVRTVWSMHNDNTWRKSNLIGAICIICAGLLTIITTVFANGFNSHPRFPFCKRVSHFESDLQILYPTFHFCNDFPVFSLAFMI